MATQEKNGKNEPRDAAIHVRARRGGEEVDESRIHQHEAENNSKMKRREEDVRRSQSAVMNEKREHEVERSVRSRQRVQTSRESAENSTSFFW